MKKTIRNKLIICSLLNIFSAEEMQAIMITLVNEPDIGLEEILLNKQIWQNQSMAFKKMDAVKATLAHESLDTKKNKLRQSGIKICTIVDEDYPVALKEIYLPPVVLYYKGDWSLTKGNLLGIVGSRQISGYGQKVIQELIPALVKDKVVTVSGLAKGVDFEVHQQTLVNGGKSIAVVGTGLDHYYPTANQNLQTRMAADHLVISEYPVSVGPKRHHFPMRNRIIVGISQGVLVIEAKERSGSLITANVALQENREVFAVPGDILNPAYRGTNQLIQAGAKAVLGYSDIVSEMERIWQKKFRFDKTPIDSIR